MSDTDITAEPAAEDHVPPPAETAARPRVPPVLVAALAAALVVATALGIWAATLSSRLDAERSERREVRAVSGRLAEALLTYDYTELERSRAAVLREATGKFRSEYQQAFSGLQALLEAAEARSTATVTEVYISDIEEGRAASVVVVDAVGRGIDGPRPVASTYIQLDLVRVDGDWKVDGVAYVRNVTPGTAPTPPADGAAEPAG